MLYAFCVLGSRLKALVCKEVFYTICYKGQLMVGVVVYAFNPSTQQETDAGNGVCVVHPC